MNERAADDGTTYLAFDSTHVAMAAQKACSGLRFAVIPTPREITASCGMTLKVEAADANEALERMAGLDAARGLAACYRKEAGGAFRLVCRL